MKKVILLLLNCFILSSSFGQASTIIAKFSRFYKANQADSIYTLFSAPMKSALHAEGNRQFFKEMKEQLGEITGTTASPVQTGSITEFRLSFEKPIMDYAVYIENEKVAGIYQKEISKKRADALPDESPDNFSVENKIGKLYGTLTLPKQQGKVPVVVMIGGSGPTDRNMNQGKELSTNSFLMLAKGLAANGIAAVRYDKRAVGKSAAATQTANISLDDYINDANLFFNKLSADSRFSKVIILGHSEGALIGLIAALQVKPAAYISLCGMEHNLVDLMGQQLKPVLSLTEYQIFREIADSLKAGKMVKRAMPSTFAPLFTPSSQSFLISSLKYDASTEIKKLNIPLLVVGGTTDIQIPAVAATHLAKLNSRATLKIIPGMNHILKKAPLDQALNVATYSIPSLPLHPGLLPVITAFIKSNIK